MKKLAILAIGTAIILGALAAAYAGTEGSPAKPSIGAAKFVSKRYGYSIVLAARWKPKYARTTWTGSFPLVDNGEVDAFMAPGDRFFVVAATKLPVGTTLPRWEKTHASVMSIGFPGCRKARAFRNTRLGGASAREFQGGCLFDNAIVVVAVHGGRGYTFQYVSPKKSPAANARRTFESGRRSFRFSS